MDPVEQVLAQQNSGSAQGQGFGSFYIQGRQLAQQQQNINLSKRRVAVEEAQNARQQEEFDVLKPLLAQNERNRAIIFGQTVSANADKLAQQTTLNNALPEILQLQAAFMNAPDGYRNVELRNYSEVLSQKYPRAFAPGMPGGDLLMEMNGAKMFKQKFQELNDVTPSGMRIQQYNPKTGSIEFTREDAALPARIQEVLALTKADAARQGITDPAKLNELYANNLRDVMIPYGMSVTTADGTTVTSGRQPVATVTKAEDAINAAANLAGYGADLIELAKNSDNVGVWGNARRFAEQYGGQFGVNIDSKSAFDYASATSLFKAGATKVLRSDGQIAEPERIALLRRVSDAQIGESSKSAIAETSYLMRKVAESARRQALRAGRPLPPELMNTAELAQQVVDGRLSEAQARTLNRRSPFSQDLNEPPPPSRK